LQAAGGALSGNRLAQTDIRRLSNRMRGARRLRSLGVGKIAHLAAANCAAVQDQLHRSRHSGWFWSTCGSPTPRAAAHCWAVSGLLPGPITSVTTSKAQVTNNAISPARTYSPRLPQISHVSNTPDTAVSNIKRFRCRGVIVVPAKRTSPSNRGVGCRSVTRPPPERAGTGRTRREAVIRRGRSRRPVGKKRSAIEGCP